MITNSTLFSESVVHNVLQTMFVLFSFHNIGAKECLMSCVKANKFNATKHLKFDRFCYWIIL